jgi:hypothetical protein
MSRVPLLALVALLCLRSAWAAPVSFNRDIRPILSANCFPCHGADEKRREAGRRLDLPEAAYAERKGVRALVPGDLEHSELWWRITSRDEDEVMPPPDAHRAPLKPEERALVKQWIEEGATFEAHWAFRPVALPAVPLAAGGAGDHPVDRFIGAALAARGWRLSPAAPPETLLRRVTLDLTGLPPSPEEIDAYLADQRPGAYERAVDRLLASPRYGEHFARYWLDAVRYADTHGLHLDNVRNIWPYRDWVVRAFNRNQRFDDFTIDQLAGDLRPQPTLEQLIGSGYNRNHLTTSEGGAIEEEAEARNTGDRTDTTAALWLGLTANCASCHNHKFDPITMREYYALGAFFKGLADRPWDGNVRHPGPVALIGTPAERARVATLNQELPGLRAAVAAKAAAFAPDPRKLTLHPADPPAEEPASDSPAKKTAVTKAKAKAKTGVTYEVSWAEDDDLPGLEDFAPTPRSRRGRWLDAQHTPVFAGQRALRITGAGTRDIVFTHGEAILTLRTAAKAVVQVHPDPAHPPRAVALEWIAAETSKRIVWGDPSSLPPRTAAETIVAGPLPPPGVYTRLEFDADAAGLKTGVRFTGLRLLQAAGEVTWDSVTTVLTSPGANDDPLLSQGAWIRSWRLKDDDMQHVPVMLEIKYLVGLSNTQQNDEERRRIATFYRDFIYGPLRGKLEPAANAARQRMAELTRFEMQLPAALISQELPEPRVARILERGQYDKPGEAVTAATPAFLPPLTRAGPRPTRLDLARWLVDPAHPLTARVTVNRFWQQLIGAGIVRTPGDFGSQGEPPTHPELLDWLAREFVRSGWDVKALVRLIVTSRTYRQSAAVDPAVLEADPSNRWLAHAARLRLDGEVLRDQALALGGLLRPELGGPPVKPYQPINIWEPVAYSDSNTKAYVQDHGEALYRRSLYTFVKRTAPAPAMANFDAPSRELFCVVRGRSDTPLQALQLMNDVQHIEAARGLAQRLLHRPGDDDARLTYAFRATTGRRPEADELKVLRTQLADHRRRYSASAADAARVVTNGESLPDSTLPLPELAAWTMIGNLVLNLDEAVTRN